jgi:hypothetical protein
MPAPRATLSLILCFCAATGLLRLPWPLHAFPVGARVKHDNSDHLNSYRKTIPLVEWPPAELVRRMPELKGFTPADSQELLSQILKKVGANVQSFFHNFMSTASMEEIHQLRMGFNGGESFNPLTAHYLLLGVASAGGTHLQEYRTNSKGKPMLIGTGTGRGLLTHGFASASVYFDTDHQALSTFRYLGRKAVDNHNFLLVAFAQRVDPRGVLARFNIEGYSIPVLVQGAAWIDPESYQIERLRTDLLAPQLTFDLDQLTTDVTYDEVHFKGAPQSMWLPRDVRVTVKYQNVTYHNEHRYSDYKLFNVEAGSKKPDRHSREEP